MHLITDNGLNNNLQKVYEFLRERYATEEEPGITAQMLTALSREMKTSTKDLKAMIDSFEGVDGGDLSLAEEMTQRFAAVLPPV